MLEMLLVEDVFMSRDPNNPSGGDSFTHMPLPYLVHVDVSLGDDTAPVRRSVAVVAYSMVEAMLQAGQLVGAEGIDSAQVQVRTVEPDVEAYWRMVREMMWRAALT